MTDVYVSSSSISTPPASRPAVSQPSRGALKLAARERQVKLCQRITFVTAILILPFILMHRALTIFSKAEAGENYKSVFTEARAAAGAVIPFIFMG